MASDLSAFHRIDDMGEMPSVAFFRLAYRLPCYRGVMRERVQAEQEEESPRERPSPPPAQVPVATRASVAADPVLSQWIGFA